MDENSRQMTFSLMRVRMTDPFLQDNEREYESLNFNFTLAFQSLNSHKRGQCRIIITGGFPLDIPPERAFMLGRSLDLSSFGNNYLGITVQDVGEGVMAWTMFWEHLPKDMRRHLVRHTLTGLKMIAGSYIVPQSHALGVRPAEGATVMDWYANNFYEIFDADGILIKEKNERSSHL